MSDAGSMLVFTDMDGSLLDHHDYSFRPAQPLLRWLETAGVPVIPNTSKTRAELESLRRNLHNAHPFIVENGAAVFIPIGYFAQQPAETRTAGDFWVRELSAPRQRWLDVLAELEGEYPGEFTSFQRAGTAGVMALTGLPESSAAQANLREYSEPVSWLGDAPRREAFVEALRERGANPLQGGRFLTLAGDCDKGRALRWLRAAYLSAGYAEPVHDIAIGDSGNDIAMLETAETALVVRSPVHDFPQLERGDKTLYSTECGPSGWAEGVARWLEDLGHCGVPN
ncbi:HAD-IIB family hydrolase [Haliea sp. E17]|uniref:HAD-IIB family hydrolase n=1 Tax=Haliea sp. E17 TaxID=3401576 RepID=UPI003AAEDBCE